MIRVLHTHSTVISITVIVTLLYLWYFRQISSGDKTLYSMLYVWTQCSVTMTQGCLLRGSLYFVSRSDDSFCLCIKHNKHRTILIDLYIIISSIIYVVGETIFVIQTSRSSVTSIDLLFDWSWESEVPVYLTKKRSCPETYKMKESRCVGYPIRVLVDGSLASHRCLVILIYSVVLHRTDCFSRVFCLWKKGLHFSPDILSLMYRDSPGWLRTLDCNSE